MQEQRLWIYAQLLCRLRAAIWCAPHCSHAHLYTLHNTQTTQHKHTPQNTQTATTHAFTKYIQDGKSIISGWSDGRVRAFGPQTGKLLYTINDAHHKAVTALAVTPEPGRIISGGEEGGSLTVSCMRLFGIIPGAHLTHSLAMQCLHLHLFTPF